jgi:deoxycytidylate deaminase
MFLAYAASLRSGDISRQVGAVVMSREGEVIATGANDVPRSGGGLYGPPKEYLSWPPSEQTRDASADQRDYMRGYDSNSKRRREIVEDLAKRLELEASVVEEKLRGSLLNDVTEYGRAVHAEMEALLCCARVGVSPKDGTLFTTTFPCHNCTKHIVAAGVRSVRYIEPYPKSLAEHLHGDAVAVDPTKNDGRVRFEAFHGVGPRRFMDLFSLTLGAGREVSRKQDLERWRMQNADPRFSLVARSYLEREKLALDEIEDVLRTLHGGADVDS